MDWKLFVSTFAAIFLAEIGDKTQVAIFSLAASGSKWTVAVAAGLALVTTTAIAVVAGDAVGKLVPAVWMKRVSAAIFLGLGVWGLATSAQR
jgi:Ca2+/H+ antiporter, TMEM165/GDT1 family